MSSSVARDWDHLNRLLWRDSYSETWHKWATETAFRGVARRYGNLKTSLQRLPHSNLAWRERRLLDSFRIHTRPEFEYGTTDWDLMLLGQHHGLPTRLLDWTLSPLVAMFFVVEPESNEDGEIWCVNRAASNRYLSRRLTRLLETQGGRLLAPETLGREFPHLTRFDRLASQLVFFEPPGIDPRIINQYSIFSVMPDPKADTLGFLQKTEKACRKVIVPARLKREIRQRLLVMNISGRTMFPGLDGIGSWLKAYYSEP